MRPTGRATLAFAFACCVSLAALAQNPRGSAEGPTKAPGYDHPDQFMHLKDVNPAPNMYPVIAHPDQERQARDKLAALERKTGKKPNILIFLFDEFGWMGPGCLGGGMALPAVLKKLGYVTQGVGKWHMGENRGSLPQNVGYDDYLGFLGVSHLYNEGGVRDF